MKHVVTILLVASIGACSMIAFAERHSLVSLGEYGDTMSHLVLRQNSVLWGLVIETNRGVALTSNRGTLLLKGMDTENMVGETVKVSGVIRGDSFYALKILPKS